MIYTENGTPLKLKNIKPQYDIPYEEGYALKTVGAIDYHNYQKIKTEEQCGHYTAIARRRDGKWIRYNDCHADTSTVAKINSPITPAMLIFFKIKKEITKDFQ